MAQIEIYVRLKGDKKWHLEVNNRKSGSNEIFYALRKNLPSYD